MTTTSNLIAGRTQAQRRFGSRQQTWPIREDFSPVKNATPNGQTGETLRQIVDSVPALLEEVDRLTPAFESASDSFDSLTTRLLVCAYALCACVRADPLQGQILAQEVQRRGFKPNRRTNQLCRIAVMMAFGRDRLSPSIATKYSKALAAGDHLGLSVEQFRDQVSNGPRGRGGINALARALDSQLNVPMPERLVATLTYPSEFAAVLTDGAHVVVLEALSRGLFQILQYGRPLE